MNSGVIREIRLKIADIFEIDPQTADQPKEFAAITAYVLKHYAFLPKPIAVRVEGDEVVISYPEEGEAKRDQAARLAARAMKHASEGDYKKAIGIYKRVLELQPDELAVGIDGCSAPAFALPLERMARGFALLACADGAPDRHRPAR